MYYDGNGGSSDREVDAPYEYDDNIQTPLPNATREGYTFNGWWTSKNGGVKLTETTHVTKDITYYAHWLPIPINVTFNSNWGTE